MQLTVFKWINPYGFPNSWSTALKYNGEMSRNVIVRPIPVHRILIDHKRWLKLILIAYRSCMHLYLLAWAMSHLVSKSLVITCSFCKARVYAFSISVHALKNPMFYLWFYRVEADQGICVDIQSQGAKQNLTEWVC